MSQLVEDTRGYSVWDPVAKKRVRIGSGKDSVAAAEEYAVFLRWRAEKPLLAYQRTTGLLLSELWADYLKNCSLDKKKKDRFKRAAVLSREFFQGKTKYFEANAIEAPHLVQYQRWLAARGLGPITIRHYVGAMKQVYTWGYSEGRGVLQMAATAVKQAGWVDIPTKTTPRRAAAEADVVRTIPHLPPVYQTICQIMLTTGMRPSEVVRMTPGEILRGGVHEFGGLPFDLDSAGVWLYAPGVHKTARHGVGRAIGLGKDLQELIQPYLDRGPDAPLFSAKERVREFREWQQARRTGKGNKKPKALKPKKTPGDCIAVESITRELKKACVKAGVKPFTAYQLRYLGASKIQRSHGREAARAMLGHVSATMTDHYSGQDVATVIRIAKG